MDKVYNIPELNFIIKIIDFQYINQYTNLLLIMSKLKKILGWS